MINKYPKINYIGNKAKLTKWIVDSLPLKKGTVLDLFCGGCSVSYALKSNGYTVLSNDILYSNYVLAKSIIENKNVELKKEDYNIEIEAKKVEKTYNKIKYLENKLYFKEEIEELAKIIEVSKIMTGYQKYLYLSLLRRAMIRKIPYSRMNVPWNQIIKLRDEEYSYAKYKRRRAYHNYSFNYHIDDNLANYNQSIFDNQKQNKAFNLDSFDMLENLKKPVEMIYLDPPYPGTMNKYHEFYGIYDQILDKEKPYVNFSENNMFMENIEKLIKKSLKKTKFIIISQNTNTKPSIEDLTLMLKKYGTVSVKYKKHQYKVTGKDNKNITSEVLIILKIKAI